ncbi:MAG TPA: DegQ family serine endoprotease [Xanthobacteraceae bacterium]|nr:DegQ family serine endoprotease [Xanthobacteraceae bacterium]
MRILIATLSIILGLSQPGYPQGARQEQASPLHGSPTLAPLVKKVTPSVVNIAIKGRIAQEQNPLFNDPFFRRFFDLPELPAEREIRAAGSGVIVDAQQGLVITNNHVVEHADEITVTLTDGRRFQATRVGADADTDVAVIKIPAKNLAALPLGDSERLEVGDFVVAIGNPFGLGQTVTSGIVSALRRTGLGIKGYEDFIQTDAPINPGNSGGALVNLRGELIGINTAIIGPSGGNVGIGFAIPANMVRDVMDQLVKFGEVRRGQLGIMTQDLTPELAQAMGLSGQQTGALVAKIESGSAAERAGLKVGDVITEVGKVPVRGSSDLRNKIGLLRVGNIAELTVLRERRSMVIRATLTAPLKAVLQGGEISPLLEGASFGPTSSATPTGGVEIVAVQTGSKAFRAGLRKGDIITSVNQEPVSRPDEFAAKAKESPKRLLLNLLREGTALFIVLQG